MKWERIRTRARALWGISPDLTRDASVLRLVTDGVGVSFASRAQWETLTRRITETCCSRRWGADRPGTSSGG